jgi:hypothetical protein
VALFEGSVGPLCCAQGNASSAHRFHAHIAPDQYEERYEGEHRVVQRVFRAQCQGKALGYGQSQEDQEQQRPFGPRQGSKPDESRAQRQMPRSMRATKRQELPKRESGHRGEETVAAVSEQLDDNRRDGYEGHHDEGTGQGGKLARDRKARDP